MPGFRPIHEIDAELSTQIAPGLNVPHATSAPLVRLHNGSLVLAEFVFLYTGSDIAAEELGRPMLWGVADIKSGDVLSRFDCRQDDFSGEEFGARYSIHYEPETVFDDAYVAESFRLLDEFRTEYLAGQGVNKATYSQYFERVLAAMAPAYRVFYRELGSPDFL